MGISMDTLCRSFDEGVKAGYSVETQLNEVDKMISREQERLAQSARNERQSQAYRTL